MTSTSRRSRRLIGINPDEWSIQTGTDSTISGIRGHGRTLDSWLGRGGRVIEAAITRVSLRLAPKPTALFERLVAPYDLYVDPCDPCTVIRSSSSSMFVLIRPADLFATIGKGYYSADEEGGWKHALDCFRGFMHRLTCPTCRRRYFDALSARPAFEQDIQKLIDAFSSFPSVETQETALIYIYVLALYNLDFRRFLIDREFGSFLSQLSNLVINGGADSRQPQLPLITELIVLLERGAPHVAEARSSFQPNRSLVYLSESNPSRDEQHGFNSPLQSLTFMFTEYSSMLVWASTFVKLYQLPAPSATLVREWIDRVWQPAAQLCSPFSSFLCRSVLDYIYDVFKTWTRDPSEGVIKLTCIKMLLLAKVPFEVAVDNATLLSEQSTEIWWLPRLPEDTSFLDIPGQLKYEQYDLLSAGWKLPEPSDTLNRWIAEVVSALDRQNLT